MRKFRAYKTDNGVVVFTEQLKGLPARNCPLENNDSQSESCKFCDNGVVCEICDRHMDLCEKIINVVSHDLGNAIIGLMEGNQETVKNAVSNINASAQKKTVFYDVESIIFKKGIRYGAATALTLLYNYDTEDPETIKECIQLLQGHLRYLEGEENA